MGRYSLSRCLTLPQGVIFYLVQKLQNMFSGQKHSLHYFSWNDRLNVLYIQNIPFLYLIPNNCQVLFSDNKNEPKKQKDIKRHYNEQESKTIFVNKVENLI